jgi:hypothetical protein
MDEVADVASQAGDLTDQAGAEKREVDRRDEEDCFEPGVQLPVHQGHLEFILEVAHCTKASNDDRGTDLAGEVRQQAVSIANRSSDVKSGSFATLTATATMS